MTKTVNLVNWAIKKTLTTRRRVTLTYNACHKFYVNLTCICKHRWFSGRMLACHAGGPGSIPGRCTFLFNNMHFVHDYIIARLAI